MTANVNWSYPTAIRFGSGRIAEIADACRAAGITRPLFVTDRVLAPLPMVARTLELLEVAGLGRSIFSGVDPNPTELNLQAGLEAYHAGKQDGVVAFGGGSGLDPRQADCVHVGADAPVVGF
jgi:alcohol dehydrogenase class IV